AHKDRQLADAGEERAEAFGAGHGLLQTKRGRHTRRAPSQNVLRLWQEFAEMIAQPALQPGNQVFQIAAKLKRVIAQDQLKFGSKAGRFSHLNFDRAWLLGNQGFSKDDAATTEQQV